MYKFILVAVMVTVFTGCKKENEEVVSAPSENTVPLPVVEVIEQPQTEVTGSEYQSFTSEEYGFSVEAPSDWKFTEKEERVNHPSGTGSIFSWRKAPNDNFGIYPRGGTGHGLPTPSSEKQTTLSEYPARISFYGGGFAILNLTDFPSTWNSDNRIEIFYSDQKDFDNIVNSLSIE